VYLPAVKLQRTKLGDLLVFEVDVLEAKAEHIKIAAAFCNIVIA
jgi:hypothetical protein